jgi:hypothetical protein
MYFDAVKIHFISWWLIVALFTFIGPGPLGAVHSHPYPEQTQQDERKMDPLSLTAYALTVGGLASLFLTPALALLLIPAGFVVGLFALFGGRNRFEKRKGRGLALAAVLLGGAFSLAIVVGFLVLLAVGF